MDVYLIDGTYELFRHFYALPPHTNARGEEVAATVGVLASVASLLESGVTHVGVATDHVIESFRNDLWTGYKTSEGVDPKLLAQFVPLEESLEAMGVTVWPMVELEADDAMAGAAASLTRFSKVGRVYLCSPDKDLAQCVRDDRVIMYSSRTKETTNERGVNDKFGVPPGSIPDYLALVGDTADGYPGLPGWGEKSSSTVLARYGHLEAIPHSAGDWTVQVRSASRLADTLREQFKLALLFRDLATLRKKSPKINSLDKLLWHGPKPSFTSTCERLDAAYLHKRVIQLAETRRDNSSSFRSR